MRLFRVLQAVAAVLLGILVLSPAHATTINIPADFLTILKVLTGVAAVATIFINTKRSNKIAAFIFYATCYFFK